MKWQLYNEVFDIELYQQMVSLIYRLSAKEDKHVSMNEIQEDSFLWANPEKDIEEAYGLRYPGEVLERLGEKKEITIKELRSLGLALADTREMQEDGMFIGNQLSGFWKKLQRTAQQDDLFVMGIHYLYDDKQKKDLYEKLLDYDGQSLEELIFILYVLPDDDRSWDRFRLKLEYYLGIGRKIDVYDNWEIYNWVLEHYYRRMKTYRKKDMAALKYLLKLPCSYEKEGSVGRKRLLERGYNIQEIMFLSMMFLREANVPKKLKINGLAAERMAVETCTLFLNSSEDQPDVVYQLCEWILKYYERYHIKLDGQHSIYDSLRYKICIDNIKSYQFLLTYENKGVSEWYYINLTDSKWDPLFKWMERGQFDKYVTETLYRKPYTKNEIYLFLERYESITGELYIGNFWRTQSPSLQEVFNKLAEMELLSPSNLLDDYIKEYKEAPEKAREKWKIMAGYLEEYIMGISKPDAYQLLKNLIAAFGVAAENNLISTQRLLFNSFGIRNYRYESYQRVDIIRPFLSQEEHIQIFLWIEQYIFKNDTKNFMDFLSSILLNENNLLWLSKTDARDIFFQIEEDADTFKAARLRHIYLSEKEQEEYNNRLQIQEERHRMMENRKLAMEKKKIFTQIVAKCRGTDTHFSIIRKGMYAYPQDIYFPIVASYIRDYIDKNNEVHVKRGELKELFLILAELMIENELDMARVKKIINCVEIKEAKVDAA